MDLNWCIVCDQHIDSPDPTSLYCSSACRDLEAAATPLLVPSSSPFLPSSSPTSSIADPHHPIPLHRTVSPFQHIPQRSSPFALNPAALYTPSPTVTILPLPPASSTSTSPSPSPIPTVEEEEEEEDIWEDVSTPPSTTTTTTTKPQPQFDLSGWGQWEVKGHSHASTTALSVL
ncbi:hypothetical protein BJ684DRAFT_18713 [Piptocephalis cylindrospora]|uniref:Uncharacterized protein n=1 Tax=Piptocephalis cylindrospora TaxID=1907219 RepID=A0A4P9Y826_9FUNG|nr:hypothetical protein BJ684DRAFT_18713 [Piptocephalis cylindrospora]|eukprot:RKP14924.1 hypothetical protein BJ684DRAFT_18713 [Piptocephalis cylindrospora]